MKFKIKKLKIKTKIIVSTFLVVAVSLTISGILTYNYFTGILKEQSIRDNKVKLAQFTYQLKQMQEQVKKTATYIITDAEINNLIRVPFKNAEEEYDIKLKLDGRFKRFVGVSDFIIAIIIVRKDGNIFSNNISFEDYYNDKLTEPWFTDFTNKGLKIGFSETHEDFIGYAYDTVISYITRYKDLSQPSSPEYFLIMNIRRSELEKIFKQSANEFEDLILMNKDNNILYKSGIQEGLPNSAIIDMALANSEGFVEDNKNLAIANLSAYDGWKQVAVISKAMLYGKIRLIFVYFIVIVFLSLLIIFIVMIPIILNITRPLSNLAGAMKKVSQGDFGTNLTIKSGDELEVIGEGFNVMVSALNNYMEASINNEKMKRRMQVDLLMSQINPHFIYNTLNSVIYLIHAKRNEDAIKITESIISILQDTVKIGDKAVFATVREELNIVDNYMTIQSCSYPGMFDAEIKVEEELYGLKIPRMIIQPLMENALFHGIYPAERHGLLKIDIKRKEDHLRISIEDNGIGMDENTIANIYTLSGGVGSFNKAKSIGIRNIKERIEFLYGAGYGIEISSRKGEGTKVLLKLPLENG